MFEMFYSTFIFHWSAGYKDLRLKIILTQKFEGFAPLFSNFSVAI